ncbi:hypothetical protein JOE23_001033 [Amphibacillus cookii]|nr:hypothetical protein [Amphibacillus cookii]
MNFMKEIDPFIQAIHQVLSVNEVRQLARNVGFIQRQKN